ncbi:MAG: diaminopimelate epimerase, partial [Acidimicrobiia bacterium]
LEVYLDGKRFTAAAAGFGNPHLVVLVDRPDEIDVSRHGPELERDPRFPARANVSFVAVEGAGLRARVWERGVGETRSCGTGACAAAAVAHRRGLVGTSVEVWLPGGRLEVLLGDPVRLSGPVASVFELSLDLGRLRRSGDGRTDQSGRVDRQR